MMFGKRKTNRRDRQQGSTQRELRRRRLAQSMQRTLRHESLEDRRLLAVFANPAAITINDNSAATPYPSAISVTGLSGTVVDVNVTISGLDHTFPDDVGLLLVSPSGNSTLLMADSGGGTDISGVNLTFDDDATGSLPDSAALTTGVFRPTRGTQAGGEGFALPANFPAPAPASPYASTLAAHDGMNPNGTWNLYAFDDSTSDVGTIASGWSLEVVIDPSIFTGDANDNDLTVRLNSGDNTQLDVIIDGNTQTVPLASLTSLTLNGGDGDDTFTIDHSNGVVLLPITVNGEGQTNSPNGDRLVIAGPAAVDTVVHNFVNENDGSVEIDVAGGGTDATITYTGLEPVIDNLNAANRVFTFTGGAELITLGDDATAANNTSQIDSSLGESVTFTNPTNSLTVNAGTGGDIIVLNAMDSLFAASLTINGDAGGDVINVRATTAGTTTTINGGAENDVINVSSDAPGLLGNLNGIAGALTVNGNGGDDVLNVSDLGGAADLAGVLSATQISGLGNAGAITYSVDALNLDLSKGPDTLTITGTHAGATTVDGNEGADTLNVQSTGGATTINAGAQIDTFNVSSSAPTNTGHLNGIAGSLTLNGEGGADLLNISDLGGSGDGAATLSATQIAGLGNAGTITYDSVAQLTLDLSNDADTLTVQSTHAGLTRINGNGGGDTINVQATALGSTTNVNGGADGDTVTLGNAGSVAGILGTVAFAGGPPATPTGDSLIIDDAASAAASYNIQPTGVLKDGALLVGYAELETLTLNAGPNIDLITVAAAAGAVTTVNAGAGADQITLNSTAAGATVQLNGQAGNDVINVRSTAAGSTTAVNGGDDDDTVNVSSDAPANLGNLNGIAGAVTVNGDGGANDVLNVSDIGGGADAAGTLSATQITGLGNAGAITYAIDTLNLDLSRGPDTLTVSGTHAGATTIDGNEGADTFNVQSTGGATTINAGAHIDTFNVSSDAPANAGDLNAIAFALTLNGDGGADLLNVSDLGGSGDAAGILSATQITGLGNTGTITYDSIAQLTLDLSNNADTLTVTGTHTGLTRINGNGGGDTVNVQATAAGSATNINGGDGGDTVSVSVATVLGTVAFGGGAPGTPTGDTLIIDDTASAAADYDVQPSGVFKNGNPIPVVSYSGVETLTLSTGSNIDQITVAAAAGMVTTVNAGAGADQITLNSTGAGSTVRLNGQAGNDVINVRSTAAGSTTTVNGGDDDDTVNVSSDAPANLGNLNGIAGAVTINGDGGTDTLNVSDIGGGADAAGTLGATQITGLGNAGAITYSVDHLNLDLSRGPDTLTVTGTHAGTTTIDGNEGADTFNVQATSGVTTSGEVTINGGAHLDTFNVSSDAPTNTGSLDTINALLTLNGDAGNDVLNVSDRGGSGDGAGILSETQVRNFGNAGVIDYDSMSELTLDLSDDADEVTITGTHSGLTRINGNGGGDTVRVAVTSFGSVTNINGGDGADTVRVGATGGSLGDTLVTIQGVVNFGGGAPGTPTGDTLILNDADSAAASYSIQPTSVLRNGALLVGYAELETLTLNAGPNIDQITVSAAAGAVTTVNAGAGNDQITLNSTGAGSTVRLNGQAGNDVINVRSTAAGSTTTVNGGDDDDTVNVSSDAPANLGNLNGIAGALAINGDGGTDALNVSDIGGGADAAGTLSATQISGLGNAAAITYSADTLNLDLSRGPDTLTVTGTHAGATTIDGNDGTDTFNIRATGGTTTINAGAHVDTFNVSSDAPANAGHLNAIASALALNGDGGADLLNVSDLGGSGDAAATLSATQIAGMGNAGTITYDSIAQLTLDLSNDADTLTVTGTHTGLTRINGNGGADTVNVQATAAGSTTNINGGDGGDRVNIGTAGSVAAVQGTVAFAGGPPGTPTGDVLVIDDAASAAAASYNIQPTFVQKSNGAGLLVAYSSVETLTLNTGSVVDQIDVTAAAGVDTTVNAGAGNDVITMFGSGTNSSVQLNGQAGDDTITVRGNSANSTTDIQGGADNDTIHVGQAVGSGLEGIRGLITVDGGANGATFDKGAFVSARRSPGGSPARVSKSQFIAVSDQLFLHDAANPASDSYTINENVMTRLRGNVGVSFAAVELVQLETGAGGDIVDIGDTAVDTWLEVSTGSGPDQVTVASTGAESLTLLRAGEGNDQVHIQTTGDSSMLLLAGEAGLNSVSLASVGSGSSAELFGGNDADTFTIGAPGADPAALAVPAAVSMRGGGGDDQFEVHHVFRNSAVDLQGGGGSDTFNLRPSWAMPDGSLVGFTDDVLGGGTFRELLIDGGGNTVGTTRTIAQGATVSATNLSVSTREAPGMAEAVEVGDTLNLFAAIPTAAAALDLRFHIVGEGDSELLTAAPGDRSSDTPSLVELSENVDIETVNLMTGSGDDTLTVTSEIPLNAADGPRAVLTFDGGTGGQDLMQIQGTDAADQITVGTLPAASPASRYPFEVASVEFLRVDGLDGNDQVVNATAVISVFVGGTGDDILAGGSGDDFLIGEAGVDFMYGREGNDVVLSDQNFGETAPNPAIVAGGEVLDGGPHDPSRVPGGDAFVQSGADVVRNFEFGALEGGELDVKTWLQGRFLPAELVLEEARLERFGRALEDVPGAPDPAIVVLSAPLTAEGERPSASRDAAVDQALSQWNSDDLLDSRLRLDL